MTNLTHTFITLMVLFLGATDVASGQKYMMVSNVTAFGFKRMYPVELDNGTAEVDSIAPLAAPKCGQPGGGRPRILGGSEAQDDRYPWQVRLQTTVASGQDFLKSDCGGALISSTWVLSAAHCLEVSDPSTRQLLKAVRVLVYIGAHDMRKSDKDDTRIRVLAQSWQQHEGYNSRTGMQHDMGLVKIPDISQKAFNFMPICLPTPSTLDTNIDALTTGWGLTASRAKGGVGSNVLKALPTRTIDPNACKLSSTTMFFHYRPTMLCIDPKGGKETVCHGDSGGPLVKWEDDRYVLIGLTSFGSEGGCDAPEPAAFTRVTQYVDYICKITGVCS